MQKIRILIVDDAVVVRRMLTDILDSDPELEVVGTAANGKIALNKLPQVKPDVMILDLDMPEMNGLETLAAVRKINNTLPIIAFSTMTERGASKTLEALSRGATDYVTKPSTMRGARSAVDTIREELVPKVKTFGRRRRSPQAPIARPTHQRPVVPRPVTPTKRPVAARPVRPSRPGVGLGRSSQNRYSVLAIGTSTGGPNALAELLPRLPANFPVPIVIVQHMPPIFTRILAERLTSSSHLKVVEGSMGAVLQPGNAYIAPGDYHMTIAKGSSTTVVTKTNQNPPEHSCRPAVDVLFRSVAEVYKDKVLAVILTGMGRDGALGCAKIKQSGGEVLAQDEASSVVWGMPGLVAKQGLAEKVLNIEGLADEITKRICGT
jgi:two-component system chemotaxis response regulator CheB